MRLRRFRSINMGDFYLPHEPEEAEKPPERDESGHWLKRGASGRYVKGRSKSKRHTKRYKEKARNRIRRELAEGKTGRAPSRTTCYSATCEDCGKTYIGIFPIRPNAERDGKRIYLCARCRGAWPYQNHPPSAE